MMGQKPKDEDQRIESLHFRKTRQTQFYYYYYYYYS